MPDVTPKTESRDPQRGFADHGVDDPLRDFMATYFDRDDDYTRGTVDDPEVFIETDWRYRNGWLDAVLAGRALIASERKP